MILKVFSVYSSQKMALILVDFKRISTALSRKRIEQQ